MPEKKSAKRPPTPKLTVVKTPAKVGLPTQLAAIQNRYRQAMAAVYDHPDAAQAALIHAAIQTMLAEKAALGVKDGEEAVAAGSE